MLQGALHLRGRCLFWKRHLLLTTAPIGRGFRHRQFLSSACLLSQLGWRTWWWGSEFGIAQRLVGAQCSILSKSIRFKKRGLVSRGQWALSSVGGLAHGLRRGFGLRRRSASPEQVFKSASQGQPFCKFGSTEPKP